MLLHPGKLAIRLAAEHVALLPEVCLGADLLDLIKRSVDASERQCIHGLVEDGNVDVSAITIDYLVLVWKPMTESR